jgi:N-acetylmuramoyl-L-alanine amidase CwlA
MMIKIIKQLIADANKPKYRINGILTILPMKPRYIAIHETANTARGANAKAHANLQSNGNARRASWHIQVDDDVAIQSLPFDECGMHAGDGMGHGNMQSIGIEICVASDDNFAKSVQNASEIVYQLMKAYNIPIENVKQHNAFSGKNCPAKIRRGDNGITWNKFLSMVQANKPKPKPKPSFKLLNTTSLVDFLNANQMPSSFSSRRALAKVYRIKNYIGTASQNSKLLELLKRK